MSYIHFDKKQLINLEYSLNKELIRSNRAGAYASTSIINCNTRKYHGLLVAPQPAIDGENHVLLSTLDETVIQRNAEFNLGIHKYPGTYNPKGHKYIRDFESEPIPTITYRVGGVVLKRESLLAKNDDRILIRFTLLDAHSPTTLRLKPFLAFRNRHRLSKANTYVNKKYDPIAGGIRYRMYTGYSFLNMQTSVESQYVHVPDWYYNIEYLEEQIRGYDFTEDLFVPGYFEMPIEKGQSIVFSAGLEAVEAEKLSNLENLFQKEIDRRIPRDTFENCLINSAQQFIVKKNKRTDIVAGFPWFGSWGRDTFISLPGLTLALGDVKRCKSVIDTLVKDMDGPLFPNIGVGTDAAYNSLDAPLWFFWALQQYAEHVDNKEKIWSEYGSTMKKILSGLRDGAAFGIKIDDDGLIMGGSAGHALTWMDAIVHGKPVTPRSGKPVEINALWYNAIMFSLEMAEAANKKKFISEWKEIADKFPKTFVKAFYAKSKGFLADYIGENGPDWSVRPNMVFAASLPYSPVSEDIRLRILDVIRKELLTPRGLRTLSPKNPDYEAEYFGDQPNRDKAYHQGTVWPWLLGHYAEAFLKIFGSEGVPEIEKLYFGFEETMKEHGIGTISEVYDGDPPHKPGGTISQAWSVAELLRIRKMLEDYDV